MKIKLVSDFHDYYDHWFCGSYDEPEYTFTRMSRNDITKQDQFDILKDKFNCKIPIVGIVSELNLAPEDEVVVYIDPLAHCGEAKEKMTLSKAQEEYPDKFASQFVGTFPDLPAVSYRHLQFGNEAFKLKYTGFNSWMSNNAEKVKIQILSNAKPFPITEYPLFAIDYVNDYAIDFNTSPGIKGTRLERMIESQWVYMAIERNIIRTKL